MLEREIKVLNPSTNEPVKINTDVTTWGELKPLLNDNGIVTTNMEGFVRQTKVTLKNNDAVLPQGDFILYLFPEKNKAGENGR